MLRIKFFKDKQNSLRSCLKFYRKNHVQSSSGIDVLLKSLIFVFRKIKTDYFLCEGGMSLLAPPNPELILLLGMIRCHNNENQYLCICIKSRILRLVH